MITLGAHRIYTGDCRAVLPTLGDGSVDAVVTSPPYNLDIAYGCYNDSVPRVSWLGLIGEVARDLLRVLKDDGHLFVNLGSSCKDPWVSVDAANAFRKAGWVLQNHIVWAKSVTVGETTSGHFKPIQSKRFLNHTHEAIYHFTKDGARPVDRLAVGVPFTHKSNIARRGHAGDRRCGGDIWFIPYETVQRHAEKFDHPAGFPVELPARCLKLTGLDSGVVLDPFMGAGTTLVAAADLGWRGIGIDLDEGYVATATKRLSRVQILDAKVC